MTESRVITSLLHGANKKGIHLLGDVPHETAGVHRQQSIIDSHVMELGAFLVAKERVGHPDLFPASVAHAHFAHFCFDNFGIKTQAGVFPLLT